MFSDLCPGSYFLELELENWTQINYLMKYYFN